MRPRASCRCRRDSSSAEPGAAASPSTILNRMRPRAARRASTSTGSGVATETGSAATRGPSPRMRSRFACRVPGEDREDAVHLGHRGQGREGGRLCPRLVKGADHDLVEQDRPLRVLGDPLGPDDRLGPVSLELEEVPIEAHARQGEDAGGRQERACGHDGPGIPVEPGDAVRSRDARRGVACTSRPVAAVRPAPAGPGGGSGWPRRSGESLLR